MRNGEAGSPANWERLESLYSKASGLPAAERAAFLATECENNPELQEELTQLLACSPVAEGFFARFQGAVVDAFTDPGGQHVDPLIGSTVGHYRVEGRLGAGGMGVVYRAHDLQLQRTVALKLLSSHLTEDAHARARFLTEARAAAALDHPNICTIHETGETAAGLPYIAMALCQGESLKSRIARGSLPAAEAASIALQMTRALASAHARGVIHRDVKPGNVMIAPDGLVKLVDFGLARITDASVTATATARGTFAYMSPELLRGEPADARSDLWSLGVVLYEMLTGLRPFRADSDAALLYTIVHERPAPILAVQPDVPDDLARVVDRLLHEDPAARYPDARALAADLAPIVGVSAPTPASGTRTQPRSAARPKRKPLLWAAGAAAAVVVVTITLSLSDRSGTLSKASDALPRVAVLFFRADTPDQSSGSIAGELSNRLIDALTVVPGLNVPSSNAMQPYRDASIGIPSIASSLRAGWLVGGSVSRSGDRIVVRAELMDSTGRGVDSRTVSRPASEDSIAVEETVEKVAVMLRTHIGRVVREARWRDGTASEAALVLLRQAIHDKENADSLVERTQPGAGIPELYRADSALAYAAAADPKWAEPLIERAWVARTLGGAMFRLVGVDSGTAALDRGIVSATEALALGKDNARAYEIRGMLRRLRWAFSRRADPVASARMLAEAEKDLDAAIRADPALPRALDDLSAIQFARGDFERARINTERAYRADYYAEAPGILYRLFDTAFETEQDAQARHWCALIARRLPTQWYGAHCRLLLMTWTSEEPKPDSARILVQQVVAVTAPAVRRETEAQLTMLALGVVARSVSADSAATILERTRADFQRDAALDAAVWRELLQPEASVRVRMGDRDGAIELLQQILANRPDRRETLSRSRIFKTLFDDPRLRSPVAN
jgi:serine/threonine protein kinase/tetratricopeptide (TPR) repeat protein